MSLLILAYPVFNTKDFDLIQGIRQNHDKLFYHITDPHFTVAFPTDNFSLEEFTNEFKKLSGNVRKIHFELTKAVLHKDELSDYYYVFLVPSVGYEDITTLHDKFYSGKFYSILRKDIDYIPHITIATGVDRLRCEILLNEINATPLSIKGVIDELCVMSFMNGELKKIQSSGLK